MIPVLHSLTRSSISGTTYTFPLKRAERMAVDLGPRGDCLLRPGIHFTVRITFDF
jgi:hypothetical protein